MQSALKDDILFIVFSYILQYFCSSLCNFMLVAHFTASCAHHKQTSSNICPFLSTLTFFTYIEKTNLYSPRMMNLYRYISISNLLNTYNFKARISKIFNEFLHYYLTIFLCTNYFFLFVPFLLRNKKCILFSAPRTAQYNREFSSLAFPISCFFSSTVYSYAFFAFI